MVTPDIFVDISALANISKFTSNFGQTEVNFLHKTKQVNKLFNSIKIKLNNLLKEYSWNKDPSNFETKFGSSLNY